MTRFYKYFLQGDGGGVEAEDGRGGAEGGEGALAEEAHGAQGQEDRLLAQGEQASTVQSA